MTQTEALARRAAASVVAIQTLSSFAVGEYERDRFTSRNGTGPSSEIDNARETPHSSHGGDEGLGAMADGPS